MTYLLCRKISNTFCRYCVLQKVKRNSPPLHCGMHIVAAFQKKFQSIVYTEGVGSLHIGET